MVFLAGGNLEINTVMTFFEFGISICCFVVAIALTWILALKEVSSVSLQQGLRHLQTAFTNFFSGRAKDPNFKKKPYGGSAELIKAAFKWKYVQVYLAKCWSPLPIRWSRQLPQNFVPRTITVKLEHSGRWSVSVRVNDTRDLKPFASDQTNWHWFRDYQFNN